MIGRWAPLELLRRIARSRDGTILTELAFTLPVMLTLGLFGAELANFVSARMQVSQIALSVADNASRIGQTDNSGVAPSVSYTDVKTVLNGGLLQGGNINFQANGRIIISSLEVKPSTGGQYIHWQRCIGSLNRASSYGVSGATVTNMGKSGSTVTAVSGSAVMFVEVYYQYRGIFGTLYMNQPVVKQEAAFLIRDDRALSSGLTGTADSTTNC